MQHEALQPVRLIDDVQHSCEALQTLACMASQSSRLVIVHSARLWVPGLSQCKAPSHTKTHFSRWGEHKLFASTASDSGGMQDGKYTDIKYCMQLGIHSCVTAGPQSHAGLQGYCQNGKVLEIRGSPNLMLYSPLTSVSWREAKLC